MSKWTLARPLCPIVHCCGYLFSNSESIVQRKTDVEFKDSRNNLERIQPTSFSSLLPPSINHQPTILFRQLYFLLPFKVDSFPLLIIYLLPPTLHWGNYLPKFPPTNYLSLLSLHSGICAFPHSVSSLTLTIVSIPLVSGEAGAVVRPDVICTMGKHVARSGKGRFHFIHYHHWANCNCVRICIVISSPIFALIVIGHTAALSSPPVIAVTLREWLFYKSYSWCWWWWCCCCCCWWWWWL